MKITLNIECDSTEEYQGALHRLTQQNTMMEPIEIKEATEEGRLEVRPSIKERANVSPGEPSITKMGADMKKSMMAGVGSGAFAENYNGKSLKYLQLMWKRGEIKFDGVEFYK